MKHRFFGTLLISLFWFSHSTSGAPQVHFDDLPPAIQKKMGSDFKRFFKEDDHKVSFETLAGGMSGTPIYKVTLNDKVYVLRVYGGHELSAYKTNLLSQVVGEHHLGPKTYYPLKPIPSQLLITDFIKGKSPQPAAYSEYKNDLAKALRDLHHIQVSPLPKGVNLCERARASLYNVKALGPFLSELNVFEKIENGLLKYPFQYGLVHEDLNTLNAFYEDHEFLFIDWANGGFGDQMGDVANLTLEFGLDDNQSLEFLKLYLEDKKLTPKIKAQFQLWRKAAEFRLMAWSYEMIYQLGNSYKATEAKMTIPELVKAVREAKMKLETPEHYNELLASALIQWKHNLRHVESWLMDLEEE